MKVDKQNILDVLNSLEIIESGYGDYPYMIVENNEENRKRLNDVGITTETINKYGDEESFCILALALNEGYADNYINGNFTGEIDFRLSLKDGDYETKDN